MARPTANTLINSLKGKIWLATSALAFFICTFGLISYLLVSFVVSDVFYAVFIPFLLLGFCVMVFGWWLSNEVVSPIEKVALLAKSLERGSPISLPKTSGSTETDELLQTLHRNNRQLQNLVGLMEKVADGDVNVALTPLESSDRLSDAFQKLLTKVSESITAKQDLNSLQSAIRQIDEEIISIPGGNLDVKVKTEHQQTRAIVETFKYLLGELNMIIGSVREDSAKAGSAAAEVQTTLQNIVRRNEERLGELNQAKFTLKQLPGSISKISSDLSQSAVSAKQSIEKAGKGTRISKENLNAVSNLRQRIHEAVKRTGKLGERSREINAVAKSVADLAQRTNIIALNASVQITENDKSENQFNVIAKEIERLAVRAIETNKDITSFSKTFPAEIGQVEHTLEEIVGEVASLSKFAIETGNALDELERYIGQFLILQTQLSSDSGEQSVETGKAFEVFINSIHDTENVVGQLKQSEINLSEFIGTINNMQNAVAVFNLPLIENSTPDNDFNNLPEKMSEESEIYAE